jgi:hypothetical protein
MRNMQLAVRAVRLARTTADVDKGRKEFKTAQAAQEALLDQALTLATRPATKETFSKIKEGTKAYGAGADEQAALMRKVLELNDKRIKIATQWDAQLHKMLDSRGIAGTDIEHHLRDADAAQDAVSSAGWLFFVTGELNQRDIIRRETATAMDELAKARKLVDDAAMASAIDALTPQLQALVASTE